jgi:drug/metabolite transporter (DMT)-like permease
MNIGYLYLFIFSAILSMRPLLVKKYSKYTFLSMLSFTISYVVGGMVLYYYKHRNFKDKDIRSISFKELHVGFIKLADIFLFVYGASIVPAYMMVSMIALRIVFISLFDKFMNNTEYNWISYIKIFGIMISIVLINSNTFFGKHKKSTNLLGVLSMFISVILYSYVFTISRRYEIEKKNISKTMIYLGKGGIPFLCLYALLYISLGKRVIIPPLSIILTIIGIGLLIYFVTGYAILKGLPLMPQIESAIFINISMILSFFISTWYFKEKMSFVQIIGIILMICIIIFSVFGKKILEYLENSKKK